MPKKIPVQAPVKESMRPVKYIVIHCTASPDAMDVGVKEITAWHKQRKDSRGRHWRTIGYHWVIRRNGSVEAGRPENEIGAHCSGVNRESIGVVLVGIKNFTKEQMVGLRQLCTNLKERYPGAFIRPHNWFPSAKAQRKSCPNFNIWSILSTLLTEPSVVKGR
jgi:N-acetylmuramoyl-L-alanine amidase